MKKMKKIVAALLAASMVMSMSVVAFAEETTPVNTGAASIDIHKNFTETNDNASTAAEFEFTVSSCTEKSDTLYEKLTDVPVPYFDSTEDFTGSISYSEGEAVESSSNATKTVALNLPVYKYVGIYKYTITETVGNVAGVSYDTTTRTLTVTVTRDGNNLVRSATLKNADGQKSEEGAFKNTYNAGDLAISKTVTGNMGDYSKYFVVTVTLTGETGKTYKDSFAVSGGSNTNNPKTVTLGVPCTFEVKHGDSITIQNLPYGVAYTVVETDYTPEGYDAAQYSTHDNIINSELDTVVITNNKVNTSIDTGISLDNMPYIMVLALVALGLVGFVSKKRSMEF